MRWIQDGHERMNKLRCSVTLAFCTTGHSERGFASAMHNERQRAVPPTCTAHVHICSQLRIARVLSVFTLVLAVVQ